MSAETTTPVTGEPLLPDLHRDPLTQLHDREAMMKIVGMRIEQNPGNVGLLVVDLNNLKTLNDTKGHPAGDELVVNAANVLLASTRQKVLPDKPKRPLDQIALVPSVFRFGGDEFAVLLEDVNAQAQVNVVAKRIKANFAEEGMSAAVGGRPHQPGETAGELLDGADKLMYVDKKAQKNEDYKREVQALPLRKRLLHRVGRTALKRSGLGLPGR